MIFKRFFAALTAVLLCVSFAGCNETFAPTAEKNDKPQQTVSKTDVMQLLYSASDSFNPYTAVTAINRELCKLLYDPLVKTDNNFNPSYSLASNAVIEGVKCTVTIKDAKFTDGSAVTADDVVYSCNLAKGSGGVYASSLYEVASVTAADSKTVVFTLTRQDPYFLNLLDFPIIKSGSDKTADIDGVVQPPVGCGRFKLNDKLDTLIRNDSYYGKHTSIPKIRLINSPDGESVSHYVEVGATDAYFTDVSNGNIVRMSGKKCDVNLNDFVYIGINDSVGLLKIGEIRYAISSAIDRSGICKTAYYNNAVAATGFFNPAFSPTSAVQTLKNVSDFEIAIENLEKIGYNRLDNDGYRINSSGYRLTFNLLVNSENESRKTAAYMIAEQLKNIGIYIRVNEQPYANYMALLNAGSFELYLGEIRVLNNMDISPLVVSGGSVAYGVSKAEPKPKDDASVEQSAAVATIDEIYGAFYSGSGSIADVASILLTQLPVIPVCYREGLLFYDDGVCDLSGASLSDIYFSIEADNR